jgi:hypothetical protein
LRTSGRLRPSITVTAARAYFLLDKVYSPFKTRRGIITHKSELGIRIERLLPESSSPFSTSNAGVKNKTTGQKQPKK